MSVDLYLGSDIGLWVLSQVNPNDVGKVVSDEETILRTAQESGFSLSGNSPAALSVHYPHLFSSFVITTYDRVYNLHPSYLPWGRGYYPMFWALYLGEPAGATLHRVDAGIDTGPIVEQLPAPIVSNGDSLYLAVRLLEKALFGKWWPSILHGVDIPVVAQDTQGGFYHSKADFERLIAEKGHLPEVQRCLLTKYSTLVSPSSQTAPV